MGRSRTSRSHSLSLFRVSSPCKSKIISQKTPRRLSPLVRALPYATYNFIVCLGFRESGWQNDRCKGGLVSYGCCWWQWGGAFTRLWRPFTKTESFNTTFSSTGNTSNMTSSSSSASWATIWLHGLGDNGPNNAHIESLFNLPNMKWHFPSAPSQPVSCNHGSVMPSWFDIEELPFTAESPVNEEALLVAVKRVHDMLDKQVEKGISADRIFLCGFSQGGALSLASALSYPKRLAGVAIFSGWVSFRPTFLARATEGKQTPFLWQHSMNDPTVLFEAGQAGPPLLASHGISCEFKAYSGLQHSISSEELTYLGQWFKARMEM